MKLTQPIKWHGGKRYMAPKIVALMPPHLHYVESYCGGAAVLLRRDHEKDWFAGDPRATDNAYHRGCSEIVNDISESLINFWQVLQDLKAFDQFVRRVDATPFSKPEWEASEERSIPREPLDVDAAVAFFIFNRQSRQALMKDFATLSKSRTRRNMNEQASAWLNTVEGLPDVHDRLRRVVILNEDGVRVIKREDTDFTLHYLDPPYRHDTRVTTSDYQYEMSDGEHEELLATITQCKGKVMLSGYPNDMYDKRLTGWNRKDFTIDNKASSQATKPKKIESVWMNF